MDRPRAVIAEDHVLIQERIRDIVERRCSVVAMVEDGPAALQAVADHQPDLLLLDLSLPRLNGIKVAEHLLSRGTSSRIIFVTAHDEPAYVRRAFEIGASGYVMKGSMLTDLLPAIRSALNDERYLSEILERRGLSSAQSGSST